MNSDLIPTLNTTCLCRFCKEIIWVRYDGKDKRIADNWENYGKLNHELGCLERKFKRRK